MLPDITVFFALDPKIGLARIGANANREVNRLDVEKMEFHQRVYDSFMELARRFPDRYLIIDASKGPEEVANATYEAIQQKLHGN